MRSYRTEVHIPADRYIALQLPAHLPAGRAIVTVTVEVDEDAADESAPEGDLDHQDIEWWDEFGAGPGLDDPIAS